MSIGETLAAARLHAGLTVTQVSASTRVRGSLISAIEQDDFSGCGGDFYARGHIRAIAHALEVDPEPLVAEYDRTHGHPVAPPARQIFEHEIMPAPGRGPNWSLAMAIVLALMVGYGVIALVAGGDDGKTAVQPTPTATATLTPTPTPTPTVTPTPTPTAPVVPMGIVEVVVKVGEGGSWMKVTGVDGKAIFQGLIKEGQTRTFRHKKSIKMVIGNAGQVRLAVNGVYIGRAGTEGDVVRRTFRPSSYRTPSPTGTP